MYSETDSATIGVIMVLPSEDYLAAARNAIHRRNNINRIHIFSRMGIVFNQKKFDKQFIHDQSFANHSRSIRNWSGDILHDANHEVN